MSILKSALIYSVVCATFCNFEATGVRTVDVPDCQARSKQPKNHTLHGDLFGYRPVCCEADRYQLGLGAGYLQFVKDCEVEPKNETMNQADCTWTFYECVIKKSLEPKELTQASYVEMMAKNLPKAKRAKILSLATNEKNIPISSHGNVQLDPMKTYWANYFNAEFEVCTKSAGFTNEEAKFLKQHWPAAVECWGGNYPHFETHTINYSDYTKCIESKTLKNIEPSKSDYSAAFEEIKTTMCAHVSVGQMKPEDLNDADFNYEAQIYKTIPKYYSKSLKLGIFTNLLNRYQSKYKTNEGIAKIVKRIMKEKELVFGECSDAGKRNVYLNMLTIDDIYKQLTKVLQENCFEPRKGKKRG